MISKEDAHKKLASLIERFDEQKEFYNRSEYNETLTRRDFIDPFFKALGWDIDNEQGYAESYREVIHEDKIKIGGATKAPDYSFRLGGGKRLFFVEAKKPSVFIKDEVTPAYQVRRYGWSAKLPISIITDFEEFAIYDCTQKPNLTDKASHGRIKYLTYQQYSNEFDFIWNTFSKEKVLKGSFDKFVQSDKQKKGTSTVDREFLTSLDTWRTILANNIALRNNIDEGELNFVVQHIIDRIIFLRIAEDRSVERYGNLQDTLKSGNYYENLLRQFVTADQRYNSGLFDFSKDKVSGSIKIDNKIIKSIIGDLYYPVSPYEFSVISVEILGSAYEQFLGKTISLSKSGRAIIEEKPEVRKAGGVYYTPQYIVEYIVKNTVGKLIEGKAPKDINKIKVVDPACGSGSFLIGAYQYLLQYHKDYYTDNGRPSKGSKANPLTPDGNLTTAEKKRILLNNIYGVDLDANAVEVTKLSLLLKCMEGETEASIATQLKLFHERVLPTLDNNIKDGNSLIDIDFYSTEIDFAEERRVKPFSWKKAFAEVFKQGGFDCVIGNPPYVFGRDWKSLGISDDVKNYLGAHFKSSPYQLDFFSIFMEKGIHLVKDGGYSSFIVPNVWLTNTYSESTRKFIFECSSEFKLSVPAKKVFEGITVDTVIYFVKKGKPSSKTFAVTQLSNTEEILVSELDYKLFSNGEKPISTSLSEEGNTLIEKIKADHITLGEIADITRGVHPYRVGGFGKSAFGNGVQTQKDVDERPYHSLQPRAGFRPFVYGKDLKCFTTVQPKEYISYGKWLAEPRDAKFFDGDRIYSRKILGKTLIVTVEKEYTVADQQVYITKPKINSITVNSLAAILGSKLMSFFIRNYFDEVNDAFPQIKVGQLKSLPLKIPPKEMQLELDKLVEQLLKVNEEKQLQTLHSRINQLQNRVDFIERRVNEIVCKLYGLTNTEIAIIDNS